MSSRTAFSSNASAGRPAATLLSSLDQVARHLPFDLDETSRANAAFQRWHDGEADAARTVDLWTYCFVRRYFLFKFMQFNSLSESDFEQLVDDVYRKVEKHRSTIVHANRYASWVSVVCKNTFLNYLRTRRTFVPLEAMQEPEVEAKPGTGDDLSIALRALHASIRFVERRSYEEISARVGKPKATIRAYVNKARDRFRSDSRLLACL
jgi:DNA-directed RNA polymerase specialized sigma24 family protein